MVELESIAINGTIIITSVGAASWLFKRWMGEREDKETELKKELGLSIKEHMSDIKERIEANRDFYMQSYGDLKEAMARVENLQRIANGRTSTLESDLKVQIAVCKQRNERRVGEGQNLHRRCDDNL
jgi:SMC interacting uncharacterized protein involved in chromosome segregation